MLQDCLCSFYYSILAKVQLWVNTDIFIMFIMCIWTKAQTNSVMNT